VPGLDFLNQPVTPYILWILGGLFLFVGALGGIIIRMSLLMFQWRREIDKEQAVNAIAIASLATLKPDVQRNIDDIRDLREKMSGLIERYHIHDRDEDDWGMKR